MTKTPNIALLIAAGVIAFVPARPGLAADSDELGRVPYQFSTSTTCFEQIVPLPRGECTVTTFPPVPAGKRLVIQRVSALVVVPNGINGTGTFTLVSILTNNPGVSKLVSAFNGPPPISNGFAFDRPVQIYADAGSTVFVRVETDANVAKTKADFVITGSLVNCNFANPCAPIAP